MIMWKELQDLVASRGYGDHEWTATMPSAEANCAWKTWENSYCLLCLEVKGNAENFEAIIVTYRSNLGETELLKSQILNLKTNKSRWV